MAPGWIYTQAEFFDVVLWVWLMERPLPDQVIASCQNEDNRIIAAPAANGVTRLSSIGVGRHSASIPAAAATKAFKGITNNVAPRNAQVNPHIVPSSFFFLLKKSDVFPKILPKIHAKPSPSVTTAMDAYAMLVGKMRSVRSMPVAKDIGAVTKWLISGLDAAAFRVIVENTGTFVPFVLAISDAA